MDFRNIPSCSEVSCWSPEALIEYLRAHNLRDCEKLVKNQGITGKRFLEMTENEIQKFPKLVVPMLIKIQQHMNKKDEKRSFFQKRAAIPRIQQETEFIPEDKEFSDSDSFEEDYESPNELDDGDYECPESENEEDEDENGDYEPPPPNIEDAHPPIFQLKSNVTNSPYADREFGNSMKNPPEPPKRPGNPGPPTNRGHTFPGYSPSSNQENRANTLGPSIDRTTKPSFEINCLPIVGRGIGVQGKKPPIPGKIQLGHAGIGQQVPDRLPNLMKPPIPSERNNQPFERKIPSPRPSLPMEKRFNPEEDAALLQFPSAGGPGFSSNTFPPRPSAKNSFPGLPVTDGPGLPGPAPPPHKQGNMNRSFSEGTCNGRPPAPIPTNYNQTTEKEGLSQDQWYTGSISRSEAETALRSINQDGTFLVRNSSKSTASHPYVLMVLYRNKVYNIQIRQDQTNNVYMLGSGLRGQETFASVTEIIDYFHKTPLLLIDGKDQSSRQHCVLTVSAGCCVT